MTQISAKLVKELRDKTGAGMGACKKALVETEGDIDKAVDLLRAKGIAKAAEGATRETAEGAILLKVSGDKKAVAVVELRCETDFAAKNENFQKLINVIADRTLSEKFASTEAAKADDVIASGVSEAAGVTIRENIVLGEALYKPLDGEGVVGSYVHHNGRVGVAVALKCSPAAASKADELLKDLCMHATAHHPAPVAVDKDGIPADLIAREKAVALASIDEDPKNAAKPQNIKEKMVEGKLRKFFEERALLEQKFVKDPNLKISDMLAQKAKELGGDLTIAWFVRRAVGE